MRDSISFFLNGVKKTVSGADVFLPLSSYLRYEARLTGTKVVCAEGDCGACTVMIAKWTPGQKQNRYESLNSCIAQTFAMDGASLVTVEALANENELSEVQNAFVRNFGGQCGFCTPGFVMAITSMLEVKATPTEQNAKNYLTGNLCRCTGYAPILKAALDVDPKKHVRLKIRFPQGESANMNQPIMIQHKGCELYAATTIEEACAYKQKNPDVVLFSGSTDLGVQLNKGHLNPTKIMSLHLIEKLYERKIENAEVFVGAKVTLSELQALIAEKVPSLDQFLNIFASPQIKNAATLVGNLANASPIADLTPVLMSLDAQLEMMGTGGPKKVNLSDFYLGYKKTRLAADEIITGIRFKIPEKNRHIENYKISQRRDLDISAVNASFNLQIENKKIISARVSLGGVAATTVRATAFENELCGQEFKNLDIPKLKKMLADSVQPLSDVRGSSEYRKILVGNLFEKYASEHLNA